MRIAGSETWSVPLPLKQPYTLAFTRIEETTVQVVRIHTDSGVVGVGTGTPFPGLTGETEQDCANALSPDALEWLEGRNPLELRALCRQNSRINERYPGARAALDIALHDLCARALGLPLVDLLGRAHQTLPTSVTIGIMDVDDALDAAQSYVAHGFRALKVKVGLDVEGDIERLRRIRQHVGTSVMLLADANQGYSLDEVNTFLSSTQDLHIELVEQPVPADQFVALAQIPEEFRRRIVADESLMSEADAIRLSAPDRPCGIFNIKLMKCGGISPALRIADIAEVAGVDLMWGCMDESLVSITAALHAAFACPATRYLDLDGSLDLAQDVAVGGFRLEGGMMVLSNAPGLGVELVESVLNN